MVDQLEVLKRLQQVDAELFRLRRAQEEKPRELEAADARVEAQAAKVKAAEERLKRLQLSQKQQEGDLQTNEDKARKLQGQLFQVKTNKEYSTLQHEIDAIKADNSLREEEILKLFDAMDQATQDRQREQQALADAQAQQRVEQARLDRELAEIEEQVGQLEREREAVLPSVPPATLEIYERVLELREGIALVPLVNDACGGCHRRLPPQVVNEVYLKAKLVTCESCNRILYHEA